MLKRVGSTVAVMVALVASGFLLGQAVGDGSKADATNASTRAGGSAKLLKSIDKKLGAIYENNSVLGMLNDIKTITGETCEEVGGFAGQCSPE